MIASFLIDILIVVLLGYAIFVAIKLRQQLEKFKENKDAFLSAINDLDRSIMQADKAIAGMHHNAEEIGTKLQKEIKEAQALFDELHFMNDAGNNLASRLEKLASQANQAKEKGAEPQEKSKSTQKSGIMEREAKKSAKGSSRAEEELLKALKSKSSSQKGTDKK